MSAHDNNPEEKGVGAAYDVKILMSYYAVDTLDALVQKQAVHVERLQAAVNRKGGRTWPLRVREG